MDGAGTHRHLCLFGMPIFSREGLPRAGEGPMNGSLFCWRLVYTSR